LLATGPARARFSSSGNGWRRGKHHGGHLDDIADRGGGIEVALSTVPPINATTKQPTAIRTLRRNRGVGHSKPKSGCR
jgi:hypothetical protein